MPQSLESQYDSFLDQLMSKLGKIDLKLATSVMYYERRFTDVEPQVDLDIHYREGTDIEKKKYRLESHYLVAREGKLGLRAVGRSSLNDLANLSKDPDVEKISGFATCASY